MQTAAKPQENKPAVSKKTEKVEVQKTDSIEITQKSKENKKMTLSDKLFTGLSVASALFVVGIMGRNGCFGKSVQKFFGGIKNVELPSEQVYKTLRIKNVLNSDKKSIIQALKNSTCPHLIENADGYTYVTFENKFKKQISLVYEQAENGKLQFISFADKKGLRTNLEITGGNKIQEARKEVNDYFFIKKYNLPDRKGVETNIFTNEGEMIYKKSPYLNNDGYFSVICMPQSDAAIRKNCKNSGTTYSKYFQDELKRVRCSKDEYVDTLIDLALTTGIKNVN